MIALLKKKSKIQEEQKPRKRYPVKNIFKRLKTGPMTSTSRSEEDNIDSSQAT